MRFFLEYRGDSIALPPGEVFIGRGLYCSIRFNDPAVSRRHLRLLVTADAVMVEDLKSANGTRLNGELLSGGKRLTDQDELQIGWRTLRLVARPDAPELYELEDTTQRGQLAAALAEPRPEPWTAPARREALTPASLPVVLELKEPPLKTPLNTPLLNVPPLNTPLLDVRNCSKCRARVPQDAAVCPSCGFTFPTGRPTSVTERFSLEQLSGRERRLTPRFPIEVPSVYASHTLSFDAVARDLSLGGVYLASELLDPVGTLCTVTMLPDGSPPFSAAGVVCHVTASATGEEGRPPGLGIKFTKMGEDSRKWLFTALAKLEASSVLG